MSQYQATLAAVQVVIDNAQQIIAARDAQTPYITRNIETLESRVGAVTLDVLRALTTLEIVACRETQGLSIHNGREYVLRLSHEGALIHFNNESGTLAGDLAFLLERIEEARGVREIELSQQARLEVLCPDFSQARVPFMETPGADRIQYRAAQQNMFGAAREADLDSEDRDAMIAGLNRFLGLNISSRTQLTPREMHIVALGLEHGCFAADWRVVRELESIEPYLREAQLLAA